MHVQQGENYSQIIPDDGREAETHGKFKAYDASIQITVLKEPNNKKDLGNHFCYIPHKKPKINTYTILII
jgi:hypothetical protein